MQLLITRNDIAQYRQISKTPNNDKLNEMILDAQMQDLAPLLGEKLYNSLLKPSQEHEALLLGCPYEYNGETYTNYGLKMVLSYFAYARYIMFSSVTDTPFSVVEKLSNDSRPADAATKKAIYNLNRENAFRIWENVKSYLIRTNHPDFNHNTKSQSPQRLRFTKIG
jgi:hypothetical protein